MSEKQKMGRDSVGRYVGYGCMAAHCSHDDIEQAVMDAFAVETEEPVRLRGMQDFLKHLKPYEVDGGGCPRTGGVEHVEKRLALYEKALQIDVKEFKQRKDAGRLPYLGKVALQHLLARAKAYSPPVSQGAGGGKPSAKEEARVSEERAFPYWRVFQRNAFSNKVLPITSLVNCDEWRGNVQLLNIPAVYPGPDCGKPDCGKSSGGYPENPPLRMHQHRFGVLVATRDIAADEELKTGYMLGGEVVEKAVGSVRFSGFYVQICV